MATGKSNVLINDIDDPRITRLQAAVDEVCIELATSIVRDGEGATKFITINVQGGVSKRQCLEIAYDIATSPLVKTAMFAADPNWGRIIAATGRSREGLIEAERISVFINKLCVVDKGEKAGTYTEEAGQIEMSRPEIGIEINLGLGQCSETVWTCDLSHDYVKINAEYRS